MLRYASRREQYKIHYTHCLLISTAVWEKKNHDIIITRRYNNIITIQRNGQPLILLNGRKHDG